MILAQTFYTAAMVTKTKEKTSFFNNFKPAYEFREVKEEKLNKKEQFEKLFEKVLK